MFVFAFFLLSTLGLYFSQILDTGGGSKKHPCYCIGFRYRSRLVKLEVNDNLLKANAMDFEPVSS